MLGREGVVYYIMTIIRRIMATQTYFNMAWSDTPRKRVSEDVVIERLNWVRLKQRPRWAREKELLGMAWGWGRTWLDGGVNRDHGRVSCATVLCWDALERISSFYDYNCLTASYPPPPPPTHAATVSSWAQSSYGKWLLLFFLSLPLLLVNSTCFRLLPNPCSQSLQRS